ncbi:MAG: pentapeptide repeat-containing protein [Chloroflexi bacterium]|nr:pentapeptide repeat-containing protein [Chloroflexota bacterium]
MSYDIAGFISRQGNFDTFKAKSRIHIAVLPLRQGFDLMLNNVNLEHALGVTAEGRTQASHDFWHLDKKMADFAERLSNDNAVAYIEAQYFGGNGSQSAIVWQDGMMIFAHPDNGVVARVPGRLGPINSALRLLDARTEAGNDEFETVGLGAFRHNDDWLMADIARSNRRGEKLYRVDFSQMEWFDTDFFGAHFIEPNFCGALLLNANFRNAILERATFDEHTTLPDGSNWTPDTDMNRFTDPDHPFFWEP